MRQWALWAALPAIAASGCFSGDAEKDGSFRAGSTSEPGDAVAPSAAEDGFVTVPAVTREGSVTPIDEVFRELRDAGLLVATTSAHRPGSDVGLPFGSAFPLPWVTDQRPDVGKRVKAGSVVRLLVVPGAPSSCPGLRPNRACPSSPILRFAKPCNGSSRHGSTGVRRCRPSRRRGSPTSSTRTASRPRIRPPEGRASSVDFDVAPAG
jgi:hypothetical protein